VLVRCRPLGSPVALAETRRGGQRDGVGHQRALAPGGAAAPAQAVSTLHGKRDLVTLGRLSYRPQYLRCTGRRLAIWPTSGSETRQGSRFALLGVAAACSSRVSTVSIKLAVSNGDDTAGQCSFHGGKGHRIRNNRSFVRSPCGVAPAGTAGRCYQKFSPRRHKVHEDAGATAGSGAACPDGNAALTCPIAPPYASCRHERDLA
jgi:hypothetical protein